jgi:hypothetical protein
VNYRVRENSPAQSKEAPFEFPMSEEEQRLIQWYLEEYLLFPGSEFRARAKKVEAPMKRLGQRLFEAVLAGADAAALYAHASRNLRATRIKIVANEPAGIVVLWELMCDPTHGQDGK